MYGHAYRLKGRFQSFLVQLAAVFVLSRRCRLKRHREVEDMDQPFPLNLLEESLETLQLQQQGELK